MYSQRLSQTVKSRIQHPFSRISDIQIFMPDVSSLRKKVYCCTFQSEAVFKIYYYIHNMSAQLCIVSCMYLNGIVIDLYNGKN